MNEKLNIQDLIDLLAEKHGMSKKNADSFVKEFFQLIEEALENIDWDDSMALRKEIRKLTKGQRDFFDRMSYQEKQKYIARLYRKGFRTDSIFRELESYRNGNT